MSLLCMNLELFSHCAMAVVWLAVDLFVGSAVYNLFLSPLARYHGPLLAKASSLSDFYWSMTGSRHLWLARNHEIYGDVVRYHPDGNVKRSKFYDMMTRNEVDKSVITGTDVALHAQKKRVISTVFSEKAIRAMEPVLLEHVSRWCQLLVDDDDKDDRSTPRRVSQMCDCLVLDVLCGAWGNDYRKIPHIIAKYLRVFYPLGHSPWLDLLIFAMFTPSDIQSLYEFVRESMALQLQSEDGRSLSQDNGTTRPDRLDMLHYLIDAKNPRFFFYIVRSPDVYGRLVDEIRATVTSSGEIYGGKKLSSCKYLHACVEEAMRITPAGPAELPRTVLPGELVVDSDYIPEGTTVGAAHWRIYRNEKYFHDSDLYLPERWVVDEQTGVTADDVARARSSCFPFAAGATRCAGKNFALLELYITIARTLWLYDGSYEAGEWGRRNPDTFQVMDSYISIRDGPVVQFRKRM
ncbi:cytochrome P450 [Aspergillus stella-maris]|uniref:cytochrome P450 n=1 Tax=Aspergillus stella-maris TaxID=1810926 RepID=UPI003CCDE41F